MTTATVTPAMQRKAEMLAAMMATFSRGRSKRNGQSFYVVPGSKAGTAHWTAVDGSGCTCVGFNGPRRTCTHVMAARIVVERQTAQTRRPSVSLVQACSEDGCDEDRGRTGRCWSHARQAVAA